MYKNKISKSKINSFIKDEIEGERDYKRAKLYNLARDERKHKVFLKKLKSKLYRR